MSTSKPASSLKLKRFIKSPPERVFSAWTTPEQVKQWFGPSGCEVLAAEIDLQVGGAYRIRVRSDRHGEMVVGGKYREISEPARLVFTWQWEDDTDW